MYTCRYSLWWRMRMVLIMWNNKISICHHDRQLHRLTWLGLYILIIFHCSLLLRKTFSIFFSILFRLKDKAWHFQLWKRHSHISQFSLPSTQTNRNCAESYVWRSYYHSRLSFSHSQQSHLCLRGKILCLFVMVWYAYAEGNDNDHLDDRMW